MTLVANESCFSRNTFRSYRSVELMEVGQTSAAPYTYELHEVLFTSARYSTLLSALGDAHLRALEKARMTDQIRTDGPARRLGARTGEQYTL